MRYRDGVRALQRGTPQPRSPWRWFPWGIAAAMLLVIAVNIGMVWSALSTFPGQAGSDGFDLSNRYDQVIDRVQQQAALGWNVLASADGHHPVLALTDHSGAPLRGVLLQATAERPVGPERRTLLTFHETAPGRYVADTGLDEPGQWDVLLSATAQGHSYTTTRRIILR